MSAGKAAVSMGMAIGFGTGLMWAQHEASNFNQEALRIEACIPTAAHVDNVACDTGGPYTREMVTGLKHTADQVGTLGWIALFGTMIFVANTINELDSKN